MAASRSPKTGRLRRARAMGARYGLAAPRRRTRAVRRALETTPRRRKRSVRRAPSTRAHRAHVPSWSRLAAG
eukprot:6890310-Alexandrium_andersonii.AAC.1